MDGDLDRDEWHVLSREEVLARLRASEHGLGREEAEARLRRDGPNELPREPPPGLPIVLLRQLRSPLIYVLVAAAIVSLGLGEMADAGFIFAVLALNAAIGGVQEWRAEQSTRALQQLLKVRATVVRDGETFDVDAEAVVAGDVVWLESGSRVPADLRLLWEHGLSVDESLLTGESVPVSKDPAYRGPPNAPIGDRANLLFAGSTVVRGRARGVVVGTGSRTAVGRLALDVSATDAGRPPLLVRLDRFTRAIAVSVLVAAAAVGLVGVLVQGQTVSEMFLFAVALAVSAIPEGLPVALTVALAVATRRMARRGVIVRRLAAVEGLGSCTLVATDKTGTLTCNALTVRAVHLADGTPLSVTGEGYAPGDGRLQHGYQPLAPGELPLADRLVRAAVLCNEAHLGRRDSEGWTWHGDPTDVALLSLGEKLGVSREAILERFPEIESVPFEPERRYAAAYHEVGGRPTVFVKGAPERVLSMCEWPSGSGALAASHAEVAAELAADGYRVLAVAEGDVAEPLGPGSLPAEPSSLTFLGFVGMIDPLRPEVKGAVAACRRAGVGVTMVTGDHPATALAIARELGLARAPEEVVSGGELEGATEDALGDAVRRARVFARVSPHQKLEVVRAAQQAGHFVAVTGDGVNDAPALREANIGVAMGRSGTDVAREAAELVLTDDNFATLVAGIEEGRVAYGNVRKVIYLLVSTGAAEIVLVLASLAAGLPLPLLAVQLLWLNLVTNGIQDVALAFEPKESDVLSRPPRPPREPVFDRLMLERTLVGAVVMGGVAFAAYGWMIGEGVAEGQARNLLLSLMVLFEIVHIGNCRSETQSLFRLSPFRSPTLLAGTVVAFSVHVAATYAPFLQEVLGTEPLSVEQWIVLGVLALSVAVAMELHKLSWALRHRPSRAAAHVAGRRHGTL